MAGDEDHGRENRELDSWYSSFAKIPVLLSRLREIGFIGKLLSQTWAVCRYNNVLHMSGCALRWELSSSRLGGVRAMETSVHCLNSSSL